MIVIRAMSANSISMPSRVLRCENHYQIFNYFNIYDVYPYKTLSELSKPTKFISQEDFNHFRKAPTIIHYLGEEGWL